MGGKFSAMCCFFGPDVDVKLFSKVLVGFVGEIQVHSQLPRSIQFLTHMILSQFAIHQVETNARWHP
jgi:hypothetical protein